MAATTPGFGGLEKPKWVSCTETSCTVSVGKGVLEYKEYPEAWAEARSMAVAEASTVTVDGLNPGSTYNFRLTADGNAGEDLVVDTQSPGCTPKRRRCSLQ
mmetsp:Transcript_11796/g.38815  ORF Transcript_11796/g.38815 Transcript_11796/m.38815 type:complete len:101 (+) Transcript_11796:779-1081(+)